MLDRQKRSGFEGTLTPPRFMGRIAAAWAHCYIDFANELFLNLPLVRIEQR